MKYPLQKPRFGDGISSFSRPRHGVLKIILDVISPFMIFRIFHDGQTIWISHFEWLNPHVGWVSQPSQPSQPTRSIPNGPKGHWSRLDAEHVVGSHSRQRLQRLHRCGRRLPLKMFRGLGFEGGWKWNIESTMVAAKWHALVEAKTLVFVTSSTSNFPAPHKWGSLLRFGRRFSQQDLDRLIQEKWWAYHL